jgi:UDP-N-acetylglucosamine 2-epimerase (non-hydrolysing)
MKPGQDLIDITSDVLVGMKNVFNKFRPDIILVHGDTSTTLSCSLAAFYNRIDIGHVEAGLRTYNLQAPFPEEFNRQVVTKIAKWHFAPTELSYNNIIKEGIREEQVLLTGNTVIDSMYWMLKKIETNKSVNFEKIRAKIV